MHHLYLCLSINDQIILTVSKPGQTSLVQQERIAKRSDCTQFIKPPKLPQRMLPIIGRFQAQVLLAISIIKHREYVLLILWPQLTFRPWNTWDPDINNPASIQIIVHAYLLLTLSSMHALSFPPGINHFTDRIQQSRYNLTVRTRKTRRAKTDEQLPRRAARLTLLVYNPHLLYL
jgi:hypothetical protein